MLFPERIQVPVPDLVSEVMLVTVLLTMAPCNSPMPAVDPVSVRVLAPAPVAVSALVKVSVPVPDMSSVAEPIVPARLITRFVLWPVPLYCKTAVLAELPNAMVPFPVVVGAPRALLPPLTFAMELNTRVPWPTVVVPL